jgi:hypothetical protein
MENRLGVWGSEGGRGRKTIADLAAAEGVATQREATELTAGERVDHTEGA